MPAYSPWRSYSFIDKRLALTSTCLRSFSSAKSVEHLDVESLSKVAEISQDFVKQELHAGLA